MTININKRNYRRSVELTFIFSLVFIILIFYFFPKFETTDLVIPVYITPEILVIDIPRTMQKMAKPRPRPVLPQIPVASENPDILDDVIIEFDMTPVDSSLFYGPLNASDLMQLHLLPRQVLEILPEKIDKQIKGRIKLSLRIGIDGRVKEHVVLENTTNSETYLANVIKAAENSEWEPITLKGKKREYWIEKTYMFN